MATGAVRGFTVGELAEAVGGTVVGDPSVRVVGVATLDGAEPDRLTFLTNPKYRGRARATNAAAILVGPGVELEGRTLLVARRPYVALAAILERFHPDEPLEPGISADARVHDTARVGGPIEIGPFAVIGPDTTIGDGVRIGAGCVIGRGAIIGDGTVLHPGVTVYPRTHVGRRCIVHSGVVLGGDGFGFAADGPVHRKIPQVGRVVVEDDVEIGANSTVDRGALEDTVIGEGSKIDDLVMVAHGVRVGRGCLLVAQAGVAGSSTLGEHVTVAGQSGVAGHLDVGDRVVIAAKSAVFSDVPDGAFVAGVPATDHRTWKRSQAIHKRLPELRAEVGRLRERVAALESALRSQPPQEG